MVRHWTRLLRTETDPAARRRMSAQPGRSTRSACRHRHRAGRRAGHQVPARCVDRDRRHGRAVPADEGHPPPLRAASRAELVVDDDEDTMLPARTHAIVLVSKIHKPTHARRQLRPGHATVDAGGGHGQRRPGGDPGAAAGVGPAGHPGAAEGARLAVPRDRPTRSSTTSAACGETARATWSRCSSPSTSSGHWWEHLLHNQSALRLKGRLLFTPGVMVTSVPWQLALVGRLGRSGRRGSRPAPVRRGD